AIFSPSIDGIGRNALVSGAGDQRFEDQRIDRIAEEVRAAVGKTELGAADVETICFTIVGVIDYQGASLNAVALKAVQAVSIVWVGRASSHGDLRASRLSLHVNVRAAGVFGDGNRFRSAVGNVFDSARRDIDVEAVLVLVQHADNRWAAFGGIGAQLRE